ncbi:pH-response transcription factor pacC/RIM101 [Nannizzia gypsea CBS 118893]|uniref:pH-response transcription factor pacC/RIM101 n=1 Tax=Arthroderma gypseum (strain ATCC MYA-4604 / CBS 118893) TaxID=535722 RepID=E5R3C2_ARTGP|nr:pH-response transcription factor pacC/RIM101 [Nannizzia gypsea CBS 118893]EFQ97937.1 pH-response transcription factor pacC/RIM101 [Nannizzia gypsea CBS 118893]
MSSTQDQDHSALAQQQQQQHQPQQHQTQQQQQGQQTATASQPEQAQAQQSRPQMQTASSLQQGQPQQQQPQQQQQQQQGQQQPSTTQTVQSVPVQTSLQHAAAAAAAVAPPGVQQVAPNSPSAPGSLECQWQGCQELCPTPEALYEHVCERHVGRKSTNNLNLTCGWSNCRTTTVKRDHITSHIRVHVPLKPHKCDFCGKAFKRPQDLKKHVKTHADDSVLVRSPEPGAGQRQQPPSGMFGVGLGPDGKPAHFFEGSLGPVPQAYGHPPPQYYQPQHPQQQPNPSYGNVYYAVGHDAAHQASYENKKRGYDALNEFFGDLKRRQFDPTSYAAVGQRLLNLHGLPLPLTHAGAVPEYQPMPAMVSVGGGHGGYQSAGPIPTQSYHLPPMGNLRTKADLMNIDQFLEQMQSTVYESDENVAAAGVAQPGAHYVQGPLSYRTTNSPPTHHQSHHHHQQHPHATATVTTAAATSASMMPTAAAVAAASRSPHASTPALTPPSSAQSYTSGRSPISLASSHGMSPTHHHHPSTAGMYPTLPATTGQDSLSSSGYSTTVSSAAPPSTLSSVFDDDRRRYTGGMLQRSRPDIDLSTPTIKRDDAASADEPKLSSSVIDPALRRASADEDAASARRRSSSATPTPTSAPAADEDRQPAGEQQWVENVRLLQRLRDYVLERLNNGDYLDEDKKEASDKEEDAKTDKASSRPASASTPAPASDANGDYPSIKMHGMEAIAAAAVAHEERRDQDQMSRERTPSSPAAKSTTTMLDAEEEAKRAGENLYPVLKMAVDDGADTDGDEKMGQ